MAARGRQRGQAGTIAQLEELHAPTEAAHLFIDGLPASGKRTAAHTQWVVRMALKKNATIRTVVTGAPEKMGAAFDDIHQAQRRFRLQTAARPKSYEKRANIC